MLLNVFICHSSMFQEVVQSWTQRLLRQSQHSIFIDWEVSIQEVVLLTLSWSIELEFDFIIEDN